MKAELRHTKTILLIAATVLITLNLYTFVAAYPETYTPSPGINTQGTILAKDFSAYYVGAWRLWHNPSQIYHFGALGGAEPFTPPYPEAYKYLPSFLLFITPFLSLGYQQALLAFNILQFLLLPIMAYMLYKLLGSKHVAVTFAVMVVALLLPFPSPNGGLSLSYYWQWGEGQAKVFLTFLLLLSFYLGSKGRPTLSGIALALGFFDIRFGLLAIPLFIMYNRKNIKTATASTIVTLAVLNLMLLYPGIGSGFLSMAFASGVTTPLYYYSLIPFFTLMTLIVVNFKELVAAFDYKRIFAGFTGVSKSQEK
jgi:Glycosyltransferase family 87